MARTGVGAHEGAEGGTQGPKCSHTEAHTRAHTGGAHTCAAVPGPPRFLRLVVIPHTWAPSRAVLKKADFCCSGQPPGTNRQPPRTVSRHQPPIAINLQPTTAGNLHQPASAKRQPPCLCRCQTPEGFGCRGLIGLLLPAGTSRALRCTCPPVKTTRMHRMVTRVLVW